VIKSRRIRLAEHVARIGGRIGAFRVLVGNVGERDHLEDPGIGGRIILKLMFMQWDEVL